MAVKPNFQAGRFRLLENHPQQQARSPFQLLDGYRYGPRSVAQPQSAASGLRPLSLGIPETSRITAAPTPMSGYGYAPMGQGGSEMPHGQMMPMRQFGQPTPMSGYGMAPMGQGGSEAPGTAPLGQRIVQMTSPSTGQNYDLSPQLYSQYVGRQFQRQMDDMRSAGVVPEMPAPKGVTYPGAIPVLQEFSRGSGPRRDRAATRASLHAQPYIARDRMANRSHGAVDWQSPLAGYPTQRDPFTGALAGQDPWQQGGGLDADAQLARIQQWQQQNDQRQFGASTLQPSPRGTGGMALVGPGRFDSQTGQHTPIRDPQAQQFAHEGIAGRFGVSAQDYGLPELQGMARSERQATLQSRERNRLQHLGGDRARGAFDKLLAGRTQSRETMLARTGQPPVTTGLSLPSAASSSFLSSLGITDTTPPEVIMDRRNRPGLSGAQRQALRELAEERQRAAAGVRRKREQDLEDWSNRLG